MKRGLVVLDPADTPLAEFDGRVAALQRNLEAEGAAAALIYGDVYRSGDIRYLTNLCLYWSEALLLVPILGRPALFTRLSPRVHNWMRETSTLTDLRSGDQPAALVGRALGSTVPGTLGLVERDWWPSPLLEQVAAALPGWRLRDLGPVVRRTRRELSASETALLRRGGTVTAGALAAALGPGLSAAERVGLAERSARLAGIEDVSITCAPVGESGVCIEALGQFRGYWTEAARVLVGGTEPAWLGALRAGYASAAKRLRPGAGAGALWSAAESLAAEPLLQASGAPPSRRLDLIQHFDLETRGEYRLPDEASMSVREGEVVGLGVTWLFEDGGRATLADTYRIGTAGAECLTSIAPA